MKPKPVRLWMFLLLIAAFWAFIFLTLHFWLEQEPEQMRLFDCKTNIIHSNSKRSALLRLFDPHQIVRMVLVSFRIDCPLQFFNRCKMIHDGLCGAMQPLRYRPCVDVFRACFAGNRKGRIQDHFFCDFHFCGHICASIYNPNYI